MPAEPAESLSPEQIAEIYQTVIKPTLFADTPGDDASPTLVLLGGQPGSGRSRATSRILRQHQGMVAVSGDELRMYHPRFRDLTIDQPEQADVLLAQATRPWVRSATQDSLDERRSVLLGETFDDPEMTIATASRFHDAGFRVQVVAIASPRVLSLVTTASRYLADRKVGTPTCFIPLTAHDRGYDGTARLIDTVDSSIVDQVSIVSRNGNVLFDQSRADPDRNASFGGAHSALAEGRNPVSWGAHSTMELLGELKQITRYAMDSEILTEDVAELLIDAHQRALSDVIPQVSVDADSPQARFIQKAVSEQLVALRRASDHPGRGATRTGAEMAYDLDVDSTPDLA